MQMGETIRKYRKEKNLTQEEMARRLGVTPPAVNKWENGNSCPDIALLAPIARLLDISLDTLLEFRSNLTDEEITNIVNEIDQLFRKNEFDEAYHKICNYLEEYPNSDKLTWQLAAILNAQCLFRDIPDSGKYDRFILECYERVLKSNDEVLRAGAADSLYSFFVGKEKYQEAEKYLQYFSGENPEKKRKQAFIMEKTGRREEAYKAYEELLFSYNQMILMIMNSLYMLSVEENDMEYAHYYIEKQRRFEELFEMGPYYEVCGRLDLAVLERDEKTVLETACRMLDSAEKICDFRYSKLYRHMSFKPIEETFVKEMKKNLLKCFDDTESYGFMQNSEEWKKMLKKYAGEQ